ncbi:MAG: hypothetical protein DRH26_00535 [Deltaproteobacteria bacterium]|nr:MAG: hypothetical protein DRH26_00535 [Deltaproteobacteria bacterium]
MNQERDKFLTEEVLDECWHEFSYPDWCVCIKCKAHYNPEEAKKYEHNNFSTGDGFIKLWSTAMEKDWWSNFCRIYGTDGCNCWLSEIEIIYQDRFADALYEFLKERIK